MKEIREDINKEVMDLKTPYVKMSIVLNEFINSTQSQITSISSGRSYSITYVEVQRPRISLE